MNVLVLALCFIILANVVHSLQPKGIFLTSKSSRVIEPEPIAGSFSLKDMLSGSLPGTLGSWTNVIQQLRNGELPSTELHQAMSSTMLNPNASEASGGSDFEKSLKSPAVQDRLQKFIRDPELLNKKLQNNSLFKALDKANPMLASIVRSPDMLQLVLKSMQKGEPLTSSLQKMFGDAAGQTTSVIHSNRTVFHRSATGWLEFDNGLKIKSIRPGDGKTFPISGDTVSVQYIGYLKDGTKFDSSLDRGLFNFTIGNAEVIEGWDTGLRHMSRGEKAVLQIPSAQAYGSSGIGPIPPNADLIFEITLHAINKAAVIS